MQEAAEEAARTAAAGPGVVELQNLAHLDAVVEAAGPDVVAVCFYSRVRNPQPLVHLLSAPCPLSKSCPLL